MACPIEGQFPLPVLHQVKVTCFAGLLQLLLRLIQVVYITLMMFVMMDAHGCLINMGFQRIVRVGKRGELVASYRNGLVLYASGNRRIVLGGFRTHGGVVPSST
ncbi:hypothetical protein D3C72_1288800 [compost metagenome]